MKKALFLLGFFSLFFSAVCFSQKETQKWYISGKTAVDFSSGAPLYLSNNAMYLSWEGCSSISDANGNLLFYTEGLRLYDKNHTTPSNGFNLTGCNSVTQIAIFVPKPGNANIYYLFIIGGPTGNSSNPPWSLYYNEIDLTLNAGNGDISVKNAPLTASSGNCSEKMTVTKHCNGVDYWLLVHDYTGNTYRAYLITAAGISTTPVVSNVGTTFVSTTTSYDAVGQMKFSPNGNKVAVNYASQSQVEICDFNKSTGVVSNPLVLGAAGNYSYGVEFSPDNSKVYSSNGDSPYVLHQWDLCAGSPTAIAASLTLLPITEPVYSLQLGPDKKLYGKKLSTNLSVINNPNVAGAGCNYASNGVVFPSGAGSGLGLPNFITSYFNDHSQTFITASQNNSTNCQNNGNATASICYGFGAGPFTYKWSNGFVDGPTASYTSTISNLAAGTYSVIISDASCTNDTAYYTIGGDIVNISLSPNVTIAPGSSTIITDAGTGGIYSWSPALGLDNTTSNSVIASPENTTTYCVKVTAASGCVDSACVTVFVETDCSANKNLMIPNAFSPNDDGANDKLCVLGPGDCMEDFILIVYSRWGEKVFATTSQEVCWDGKYNNTILDTGVFTYYLKVRYKNTGGTVEKRGNVSLVR